MKLIFSCFVWICLYAIGHSSSFAYEPEKKPDNAWSKIKQPFSGKSHAIGSYANGCMVGAQSLPEIGDGYLDMRRNRNRFYGQPVLIDFIRALGRHVNKNHGKKHLIGDLSQPRGGIMNFGHSSHQIGLDVDIWMQTVPNNQKINSNKDMESIVDKAQGKIIGNHIEKPTRDALYFSATHPEVARIFVNPVVKNHLCQTEINTTWLRKLRPWWGHDKHFHARLKCPATDFSCKNQAPIPAGSGCNDSLTNWVNEQSDLATGRIKPTKKTSSKKKKPKVLPDECYLIMPRK